MHSGTGAVRRVRDNLGQGEKRGGRGGKDGYSLIIHIGEEGGGVYIYLKLLTLNQDFLDLPQSHTLSPLLCCRTESAPCFMCLHKMSLLAQPLNNENSWRKNRLRNELRCESPCLSRLLLLPPLLLSLKC